MEIPNVDGHKEVEKSGYLQKLGQRTFTYSPQWKRKYFVLSKGKLYFYDKADSCGSEKGNGIVDLKYFDHVVEADQKESKKTANTFLITSKDRSIFDPGRYLLSADSKEEMTEWMEQLRKTMEYIKNNNKPAKAYSPQVNNGRIDRKPNVQKENTTVNSSQELHSGKEEIMKLLNSPTIHNKESQGRVTSRPTNGLPNVETKPLDNITRTRARGPAGRRAPRNRNTMQPRASSMVLLNPIENGDSHRSPQIVGHIEKNGRKLVNESYPSFAYFYSDEEDSDDELWGRDIKSSSSITLNSKSIPSSNRSSVHFAQDLTTTKLSDLEVGLLLAGDNTQTYNSLGRSFGRTSGRTSPTMDALEDLLMNQSIQQVELVEEPNDDNDSDSNTYLATASHQADDSLSTITAVGFRDHCTDLEKFSSELKHLRGHLNTIDSRTTFLEKNNAIVEVATEVDIIRNDVQNLTSSVNFFSTEFTKLKFDLTENIKKTEFINRQTLATLSQAEKSKEEYQSSKRNYDELVCELYNFFSQMKESIVSYEQPQEALAVERNPVPETKRDSGIGDKSKEKSCLKSESTNKLFGQSFFQRPSSIFHGLAAKSHIFSLGDKDKNKITKQNKDRTTLAKSNITKSEKNLLLSKTPESKKKKTKESDKLLKSGKSLPSLVKHSKANKMQTKMSADDIPMMDDSILPDEKSQTSSRLKTGISHISINVQSPSLKTSVSSNETNLYKNVQLRKNQIKNSETNIVNSLKGSSSPSSNRTSFTNHSLPSSPLLRNNLNYISSTEKPKIQNCISRQSSLPESRESMVPKTGISSPRYAIMRQSSSPNLPLKRQSSGGSFPILRQNSLGIVPEEVISRQSSLLSVPEERLLVDQTIPGSLSASIASFQLTPSLSSNVKDLNNLNARTDSQSELVISSSSDQLLNCRQLPSASEFYLGINSATTSSLKKKQKVSKLNMQI